MRQRNAAIELLRILLMFGICMCHSVGAGGHMFEPLRNICMMCTVGFVFITGWFGIRLSVTRVLKLLGIAIFAWVVVAGEDLLLHGRVQQGPVGRMMEWWFLRTYLMLMILSPILNCVVSCVTAAEPKIRRDALIALIILTLAIYGVAWPMHCRWLPQIRVFLTMGSPCQPGTMCAIYLVARVLNVTGLLSKLNGRVCLTMLLTACGFAVVSGKFSFYNSPFDLLFSIALFCFFSRIRIREGQWTKAILLAAPSMFFVYLYHSHKDPGFVLLQLFQCRVVDWGMPVPLAWILTAVVIFALGLTLDAIRRIGVAGVSCGIRAVRNGFSK